MWASSYWADPMWAGTYWAHAGAAPVQLPLRVTDRSGARYHVRDSAQSRIGVVDSSDARYEVDR